MSSTANKKQVNNALAYEFNIRKEDVTRRVNFGSWEVVETKKGILFKTYTGYHVFTTPYVANPYAEVQKTSLYQHLQNLLDMSEAWKDKMDEKFDDEDTDENAVTKGDLFDSLKVVTEAVCILPTFAFTDTDLATKVSGYIIDRLRELTEKLKEAISSEPSSDDDNLKAEALEVARVQASDTMAEIIGEVVDDVEAGEH